MHGQTARNFRRLVLSAYMAASARRISAYVALPPMNGATSMLAEIEIKWPSKVKWELLSSAWMVRACF
ncbi:MAG: hypothetical protein EXQ85_04960 [Alphaproteobacteria bacterium]|nr:hypothetical protein [Alphaproteobacteria bacterium]